MTATGTYLRWLLVYALGVVLAGHALAGLAASVEEDYKQGLIWYNRGDMATAINVLRKGADAGHAPSQALLGDILDNSDYDDEAVAYYRKAAEQGHADGEFGLGRMYATGEGVKRDIGEARRWITRAAERGHGLATAVLAQAYMRGELGITDSERHGEVAFKWIRRAAEQSHLPSLEYLAQGYRKGINGLVADAKQAEFYEARVKQVKGATQKPPAKRRGTS